MKILFFASDFKIGLSALLTDELIAFHQYGIDICAVAGEKEQEPGLTEQVEKEHIQIFRVNGLDEHQNFNVLVKQVYEIVLATQADIIHVQNNWQLALVSAVKYRINRKVRIVYTLHGFRNNSKWKSFVAQFVIGAGLLLFADRIICMSSYLKKKFRLLSYKIDLLPLGVSATFLTENVAPLPNNGLHMIFPAQFRSGKNQDIIIKAFAEHICRTGDNDSKLMLPGSGILQAGMKALAYNLGVSDRVFFPGQQTKEEIRRLYLESNIGIVSSNSETFGQSIVEPFVLGRCVISTPVGIANDIIKNNENGFIYNNYEELVYIMDYLYDNQKKIAQIGQTNYKNRYLFDWQQISLIYDEKILKTLV